MSGHSDFMEHGYCLLWKPGLVGLHVVSDIITGLSYYAIAIAIFYFMLKRRDLPFPKVFLLFGVFIFACGTTHLLAAYTIYVPVYWQEGVVKAITAIVSAAAAIIFIPLIPKAIALPSLTKALDEIRELNKVLENQVEELKIKDMAIEASAEELNIIFNSTSAMIWHKDTKNNFIRVNKAAADWAGLKEDDIKGKSAYDVFPADEAEKFYKNDLEVIRTGLPKLGSVGTIHPLAGEERWTSIDIIPTRKSDGVISGVIVISTDLTEYKRLEQQLFQAQKMEAIGQFSAGISHDFNNILSAMMGYITLAQMKLKDGDSVEQYMDQLLALAERAAFLTKSLLAFGRKQLLDMKPISINEVVSTIGKLLSRVIGEDIKLNLNLWDGDIVVNADSMQIGQALMNLATNARDAMPEGGTLTISTSPLEMDDDFVRLHGYGNPGKYALLSAEDTGMGMDKETKEKIFEPFFTSKGAGKGTGLGLAMVYGIVKQHDGYINVYSEVGKGTTFRIYLPAVDTQRAETNTRENIPRLGGTETILLVEDEALLRSVTRSMLEEFGYRVIEAEDGNDAVRKFDEHKTEIRLVLMDVIMPDKSGKEAYQEMQKMRPGIKVIFTSGHSGDILTSKKISDEGLQFISKPVLPKELLDKIRGVLDN